MIFRPSFVFGRDGGILPTFRKLARLTPVTPITGKGTQRIQPIWIDDVAAYFAAAVDQPEAANRTFDLGGPDAGELERVLGPAEAGARRPEAERPRADGLHARSTRSSPSGSPATSRSRATC